MLTHPLMPKLKALKLSGMAETLDGRSQTAQERSLAPLEFLALLLDDEIERRDQGRLRRRIKEAGLEEGKTLARFDFAAAPRAPKTLLADLALCRFVARAENLLFTGPAGTGKSHLAQALAYEAIKRGYKALCRPVHLLLGALGAARADGTYPRARSRLVRVDVLVLDDFGLIPLSAQAAEDLYEIIRERYEQRPIVLTSNRAPEEWDEIFGNPLLASAALDRLTHHAHMLELTGSSYRQRGKRREAGDKKKAQVSAEGAASEVGATKEVAGQRTSAKGATRRQGSAKGARGQQAPRNIVMQKETTQ